MTARFSSGSSDERPSPLSAREHAEEASLLIQRGDALVTNGSGPGEPSRVAGRKALYERATAHALASLALSATERQT